MNLDVEVKIFVDDPDTECHTLHFYDNTNNLDKELVIRQAIENIMTALPTPDIQVLNLDNNRVVNMGSGHLAECKNILIVKKHSDPTTPMYQTYKAQKADIIGDEVPFFIDSATFKKVEKVLKASLNELSSPSLGKEPSAEIALKRNDRRDLSYSFLLKKAAKPEERKSLNGHNVFLNNCMHPISPGDTGDIDNFEHRVASLNHGLTITTNKKWTEPQSEKEVSGSIKVIPNEKRLLKSGSKRMPYDEDLFTRPLEGNNPLVLSNSMPCAWFSFVNHGTLTRFEPKMPPPTYIPYRLIAAPRATDKISLFKGIEINSAGEIKCIDEEIIKKSKGILSEVLKKIATNIKEIGRINIPIRIFESRSLIERVCDAWAFTPTFLIPAAKETNPVERMKKVVAFFISGLYCSSSFMKPFNPLLGETYQGYIPGCEVSIFNEQSSHHPAIMNFLMVGKEFRLYGRYEFALKFDGNHFRLQQEGPNIVEFSNGDKIVFNMPELKAGGMFFGDRTAKWTGVTKFIDEKNKLKCIIKFNAGKGKGFFSTKRTDVFHGKIYRYKQFSSPSKPVSKGDQKKVDVKYTDVDEMLGDVSGSWLENLKINDEELWHINKFFPTWHIPVKAPLPSDYRYREDLIWIKHGNLIIADEWKMSLENRQRLEKTLREEGKKKRGVPIKKH
jgi:hypothetical protein